MEQSRIDWPSFALCALILVAASIPLFAYPEVSEAALEKLYGFIASEFGVFYLLASVAAIGFLVWLGLSRYGALRLGEQNETPEFGEISWVGMLFCAGVGAGLLYWCATEWAYYYDAPPFGAAPRSVEAQEWASTYGLFHWGFTAWAFYCLPAIAIAYPYYTRKLQVLRFSVSCHWFLKDNDHGPVARSIDFLFMVALLGGAASSLGFSTPMIAACLGWLFGIEVDDTLEIAVVLLCIVLFALSVWLGLKKGIKRLSDINVLLAFGLLLFILLVGPTTFLLKTSLNSVGLMADSFLRISSKAGRSSIGPGGSHLLPTSAFSSRAFRVAGRFARSSSACSCGGRLAAGCSIWSWGTTPCSLSCPGGSISQGSCSRSMAARPLLPCWRACHSPAS
jgi:BCCT family betaine/carnitine transporter